MEKIRITPEEVARVNAADSRTPPPNPQAPFAFPSAAPPRGNRTGILIAVSGAVVLILIISLILWLASPRGPTLEDWVQSERAALNKELAQSPKSKELIERIHPLVTYTAASVTSIAATTVDGGKMAGVKGANISELSFVVTYRWEGPVNKNGCTEVRYVWDVPNGQLKSSKYLASNALINWDTVDWFELGKDLAPLIIGAFQN